jgi:hypothetical protein
VSWARAHPTDTVLLVGIPERIREVAGGPIPANVEIVPASQVVEMDESPALALKAKKDSSIMVAMDLLKQGRADALVTAGHSGAGWPRQFSSSAGCPGVDRPALAVQMVTETGPFVLLDIGANMDSSGNNLYQFAHMGSLYAERVLGVEKPRIALLSIGEEKGKGDQAVQQATQMLDDDGAQLRRQRRGPGPGQAHGGRGRLRRHGRQRDDEVLRGPGRVHLRPVASASSARHPRQARLPASCGRRQPHPHNLSTTRRWARRRCWASRAWS